jgi:hypothetical protein
MTDKMQPTRRAVIQTAGTAVALAALSCVSAERAHAETQPLQANQPAPRRRVPVGLL